MPKPTKSNSTVDAASNGTDADGSESSSERGSVGGASGGGERRRSIVVGSVLNSQATRASNQLNKESRRADAEADLVLVEAAQKGDRGAFRKLVERHQRRALAIAIGLVKDESDARDLVQDAFVRVYRSLDKFQGGSSFFTWLYRIIHNLAIDLLRKPGRRGSEFSEERLRPTESEQEDHPLLSRIDGSEPLDVLHRRELAARLRAALEELPPYHRGVILMREVEGMSYDEMAEAMNVSKGTIMSRLFHARQKLQKTLLDCYREQVGADSPSEERTTSDDAESGIR